jgi:23S rRNA pseudouridine2605 synthase
MLERLQKVLAKAGIASRRKAEELIREGRVRVDGKVVTEMGVRVDPDIQVIECDGISVSASEKKVYILLHKPAGVLSTVHDPQGRPIVTDLLRKVKERVYPVGRLDKDTTGLLLFTNDGELAKKLTHPSYEKKKIYHVFLDKEFQKNDLEQVKKGIELEDGFIAADAISFVEETDKTQVGIEIHSGKNRIVRRIFAHLGYRVVKLDRVFFAGLTKKKLPRGKWRFLTDAEVGFLKMS